jgi:hypothetical protein
VESLGAQDLPPVLVDDAVGDIQAHAFDVHDPRFDGQHVIIPGGCQIAEAALDDGKRAIVPLPLEERLADMPEELPASFFQQIKVSTIVDVIAHGAVRVGDPVGMTEESVVHSGKNRQCPSPSQTGTKRNERVRAAFGFTGTDNRLAKIVRCQGAQGGYVTAAWTGSKQ